MYNVHFATVYTYNYIYVPDIYLYCIYIYIYIVYTHAIYKYNTHSDMGQILPSKARASVSS